MTSTVVLASTAADSAALDAITQHHAELVGAVGAHSTALLDASGAGNVERASAARRDLVLFCQQELLPHAVAEEGSLYLLARSLPTARMLAEAMIGEHRVLAELVDELAQARSPLMASAAAEALRVLFELHADKENEFILPTLAQEPSVSLAGALVAMHEAFDEIRAAQSGGCGAGCGCAGHGAEGQGCACGAQREVTDPAACACGGHGTDRAHADPVATGTSATCGCGGHDTPGRPVLDARAVPHNIRHATVLGALDAIRPGSGLELIAPHDPLPLLAQIERRDPGVFEVSYLERGPQDWRLAIDRRISA